MFEVRPCRDREEFGLALHGIGQYFGGPAKEDQLERFTQILPVERMHSAWEDGRIVGGAGAFPYELSVPGGELRCGGVTVVGVYPTDRRRGVLRRMMDAQLCDIHERGEPIAALWASEETIYGRFGYGLASWCGAVKIDRAWNRFAQPLERQGRTRFVTSEEAFEQFPPVWEALMRERPGVFRRSDAWWQLRRLRLPEAEEANPKRFVALELDGAVQGYAIYRQFPEFADGVNKGRLEVQEAVGATPQATAEIWRFLLDVDWYGTLEVGLLPPDHPLFLLLANPRRATYRMGDGLWVRLVDVGAALSGRAYGGDGSVVVDVRDAVCEWNEGRWRVSAEGTSRTDDAAELALDVSALGSAFLGAISFGELWRAGRVEELADGAVRRADTLFAWRPLPWCPEIF
ncbi:MAG: GNAT family N-acetyltransferase [Actinomycetota bacterium]